MFALRVLGCSNDMGFGDFGGGFCFVIVLLVACLGCCAWVFGLEVVC